jgi:asparagine synthase (glutamine-hydrolysing)
MCGICGKVYFESERRVHLQELHRMMDLMIHRGPDDSGTYIAGNAGLGHRRLSIIDLSTGKQPICNETSCIWVVFNGEIYNYEEIRKSLVEKGHKFKTKTDTEVIVHLYEEYGPEFVGQLRGMFAIAVWDDNKKLLQLARDRVGIKPLYYCTTEDGLLFASEIKAILADPSVDKSIDLAGIDRFLTFYYMPGGGTLFKRIRKLAPGNSLIFANGKVQIKQYWDLQFPSKKTAANFGKAEAELNDLLRETIRLHMISDVPIGFLLSGGVDSSGLLSLAVEESNKDISTFTVGFDGQGFADERVFAKLVADKFGTKHHEITISSEEFKNFLPKYVWFMEEPVCEPPAIALYYVSLLAKQHVKVAISGEGGDEAFAGYQNYRNLLWLERVKRILGPLNPALSKLMGILPKRMALKATEKYGPLMGLPIDNYYYSRTSSPFSYFNLNFQDIYSPDFRAEVDKAQFKAEIREYFSKPQSKDVLDQMLYVDSKTWLPDDLLVKADKITMANSIELRVPFLDHRLLEFAASLPTSFKVKGFRTKHILKEVLSDRVPQVILNRPKTGFPVPYGRWLRNDFKESVRELLLDGRTLGRGYFRKEAMEALLTRNVQSGDYAKEVFSLMVLELWHRVFIDAGQNGLSGDGSIVA